MTETTSQNELETGGGQPGLSAEEASPFLNRELSWLEFNGRVLAEAEDPGVPLLERLKFLAIFGGNLDEFFMKRVGGLKLQQQSRPQGMSPDGRTPAQQLAEIGAWVRPRQRRQRSLLLESVLPELARHGVELVGFRDLLPAERSYLERFFSHNVFPILTPLGLDTSHPFPFISNLSLSLAVALRSPSSAEIRFARLKVPPSLPRWIQLPESLRFVPLEVVIAEFLERLFPGMELLESYPFRVTRAADVAKHEEQAEDLLESVQEDLRARRFASVVRLEVVPEMPEWMRSLLADELVVGPEDVYEVRPPLAARDLFQLAALPLPALQVPKWKPQPHPRLEPSGEAREVDLFKVIRGGDLLVHHPYDAFSSSVERFLRVRGGGPGGAGDQADALSDLAQLARGAGAHRGRGARQAGRGAGGAQGELRRGAQHRVGGGARRRRARTSPTACWGTRPTPRCRWSCGRRPRAASAPTSTSRPATTTPTPPSSTPTSACSAATRCSAPTRRSCSTC
jgi:polyphosphate kinase